MPFRLASLMPRWPFHRSARAPLGVDIGSAAVKVLRWRPRPGAAPEYAIRPLAAGAVVDGNIRDVDEVGDRIAEAAAALRAPGRVAVAAVPSAAVMQRNLDLSAELSDAEVEAQILLDVARLIPYPAAEASIDFQRVGGAEQDRNAVLLSVCRGEQVAAREQALIRAGLRALAVDVEHHALERIWPLLTSPAPAPELAALVDIGAWGIRLHVLAGGCCVYDWARPWVGRPEAKRDPAHHAEAVAGPLGQALQLFHSSNRHGRVARIQLRGAAAAADGLAGKLEQSLGVPTRMANPFADDHGERIGQDAPALVLAAGLALAGGVYG